MISISKTGVFGIIVIGALEAYALYLGHNGTYFSLTVAAIAGIAGYKIASRKEGK